MSKTAASAHRVPPYKRPIIVGGFLVILAIVGFVTFWLFRTFAKPTDDATHTNNSTITDPVVNDQDQLGQGENSEIENKAPQYEGEDPNELDELTGVIIYADIDEESQTLHTAAMINQYLPAGGQCVLNLRRGDTIYKTTSAAAEPEVTTSACGPFKISLADISPGTYEIEIIMTGDGKRGVITESIEL